MMPMGARNACALVAAKCVNAHAARSPQNGCRMAAVFCLVMLPAIAAIGFMIKAGGDMSLGTAFAGLVFTLLAGGVFVALLGMVKKAEDEPV